MANPTFRPSQSVTEACPIPIDEPLTQSEGLSQIMVSDSINKREMKEQLGPAIEWLEDQPGEKAGNAAIIFQVNPASVRMRQYGKRHQERNSRGTHNRYGGNNVILT